jgi:hypothetical protein
MALTCPRCGIQNPDGNSFCQACGTPLVAAPVIAAGPPPGTPPPIVGPPPNVPPPVYQSPYFAPSAGYPQPPVHRTPWMLIISAVVGLVVVMAGCGTAIAVLESKNQSNNIVGSTLPSPTPATTPTPVAQPSPTPAQGGGPTQSTSAVSVKVPAGWVVSKSDPTITLTDPAGNASIAISSGIQSPAQNPQQMKESADQQLTSQFPDTKICPGSKTTSGSVGGISGIWWELCFTVTSGAQSFPGAMTIFAGSSADGTTGYAVILFTMASDMNLFITEAKPVVQSIQWLLT